ncbi:MAG: lipoprotein signal peptidase [Flavobacteriales bacterium]|nr:lipoprotein signal peptidase [Flavobacteriales bacterium]MBP6642262.1 lipoprotein signal peptidase [Flavobacteriales bacterium]MBP7154390.1 lipoprotein signal peptidase [Flavobacteriales bacterium]HQV74156.1 lipoprotein signal peptidase [Flavobacteriales bacterium]HQW39716.1 lipoprotein signal peptidase [Flavobacteriales bacterium]
MKRSLAIVLLVLFADQALKIWVKLSFFYDSAISILGDKGYLHFIENRGMAFGMEFGGEWGKLLLTLFRIAAVTGIGYSLYRMIQRGASTGLVISVSLILAGALGNIIDSTFYGVLFSASSPFEKAVMFPVDGGYAPLLHGAVVDMFYFPLWEGRLPGWLPVWGGDHFVFFRPVFNIADAAITVGVVLFVLSQRNTTEKEDRAIDPSVTPVMETDQPPSPQVQS